MDTLGDAMPREMARGCDKIMPLYIEIGPPGALALAIMRADLDSAAKAPHIRRSKGTRNNNHRPASAASRSR